MFYLILGIALTSFSAGYFTSHEIDKGEMLQVELALQRQNAEAEAQLSVAVNRLQVAQAEAIAINNDLDKAHESAIQTANTYHDLLNSSRLRFPAGRKGCSDSVPANSSTQDAKDKAEYIELSEGADRFLKELSYRADAVSAYANECFTFVVENNCGVAK